VGESEHDWQADQRVEFADVTKRRGRPVDQVLDGPRQRVSQAAHVPGADDEQAGEQQAEQEPAGREPRAEQPGQAQPRGQPGEQGRHRPGGDPIPHPPPGLAVHEQVADPVLGAAQHVGKAGHRRGHGRALGVGQDRDAVPRQQHQRDRPPPRGRHDRRDPPGEDPPPGRGPGQGEQVDNRGDQHRERRGRVDPAAARHGHRGPGGGAHPRAALRRADQRDEDPRQHRRREELRRQPADQGERGRRGGVPEAGRDPRPRRADAEPAGEQHQAAEGGGADRADPQPLDHPRFQPREPAQCEERSHREQVARRLVLQLAELLRVPQVQRTGEEPDRGDGQVQLGVGDQAALGGQERDRHQQQAARKDPPGAGGERQPPGPPGLVRGRAVASPGQPRCQAHGGPPGSPAARPSTRSSGVAGRRARPGVAARRRSSAGPSASTPPVGSWPAREAIHAPGRVLRDVP